MPDAHASRARLRAHFLERCHQRLGLELSPREYHALSTRVWRELPRLPYCFHGGRFLLPYTLAGKRVTLVFCPVYRQAVTVMRAPKQRKRRGRK